jgi:putative NADH-flavin reductase
MRIIVFGAAGRTGPQIVEQALGHGHEVTAFVRATPLVLEHPRLRTIAGDVFDFDAVSSAVQGHSGVASALGIGDRGTPDLHERGIANIVHAMAVHDVRKLVAVSSAGVGRPEQPGLLGAARSLMAGRMETARRDLGRMEQRIMASDLEWTIVRASGLSDGPQTGEYRMTRDGSPLQRAERISRADLAGVVLAALETEEYDRRILSVAG